MASDTETQEEILREMRTFEDKRMEEGRKCRITSECVGLIVHQFADRLEAARKREQAKQATSGCETENPMTLDEAIAHAEEVSGDGDTPCRREHRRLAEWLIELRELKHGNAAAMREALGELRAELWNNTVIAGKRKFKLYEIADAALSAPPRNCDRHFVDRTAMMDEFKKWCRAKGYTMTPYLDWDAFDWLLATAEEGGAE